MNHITRMIVRLSTISSCFRIKQFTTNQATLRLSDLRTAFKCINNVAEAEALFHHMLQMNPTPSVRDYHILFQTILKMEGYAHVILMFKKLILLGREVDEYTMNTVIDCYGHLEQVELSFAVIGFFIKCGYAPDIVNFTCLIKGFFLKGKLDEGVGLFKNLIKGDVGLFKNLYKVNEITLLTVLDGLSKSGNVGEAVELLHIAEKNSWKLDVACYNTVIDGLCKGRMLKDGMELLFRMVDKGINPNVVSYTCLLHGLCMNGKLDIAFGVFNDLRSKGITPNVVSYNCLLHGLCMNRMLDFAWRIFNDLSSKGVYPTVITYTVMIQGLVRKGLFRDAKAMVEEMERVGCFPNVVTYNVIIQGCLHNLQSVESVNLVKQIVGKDFQLDAPSFFVLLRQIQIVRGMKGVYDDDVCNQLIQKLISNCAIHELRDRNDEFVINSLINKLNCSYSRYNVS